MAYLLGVAAALANALTTILQRMGVETAPVESTMRLRLLAYALRRKVWIAGFLVMIGGFLLQFSALHFGSMTTVQPILTLELPFLVAILGLWFRHPLGWRDWAGATAAAGGLAAAIAFAFTAALIKEMNLQISQSWATLFLHWSPYALAASGLAGMFLAQNAFHAGPVTASQATLVIVDPLASIAIGIWLFGDKLMTEGVRGPGEAVALVVLFLGVFSLTRSPLVASVKTEDEEEAHMLSRRRKDDRPVTVLGHG